MKNETQQILHRLGIERLSPMQEEAFEAIAHGRGDVVILSPTGSGKTLAYLLPLLALIDAASDAMQALVVVPGRELAKQHDDVLRRAGAGLRSASCYGGRAAMDEHRILRQVRPQIVFGTPGRLNDHIAKQNINAYTVRYVVIDEFDKCLEMGFHDEMSRLLRSLPSVRRRILLSATDAEQIPGFVKMEHSARIDYTKGTGLTRAGVYIYNLCSPSKDKLDTLSRLLRSRGDESSIVFLNYRDSVERTAAYLRGEGFTVSAFHGGLDQRGREDALYKFSNGSANVLVCTDLGSRGLDIQGVDNIIHYHLPLGEDGYVHRVGRTARWDASGRTFFVLGPEEQLPEYVDVEPQSYDIPSELPAPAKPRMATIYIGKGKKDKISRGDIVGFLCKVGGLVGAELGRIDVMERYAYAAIDARKLQDVLANTRDARIKGVRTVVETVK